MKNRPLAIDAKYPPLDFVGGCTEFTPSELPPDARLAFDEAEDRHASIARMWRWVASTVAGSLLIFAAGWGVVWFHEHGAWFYITAQRLIQVAGSLLR